MNKLTTLVCLTLALSGINPYSATARCLSSTPNCSTDFKLRDLQGKEVSLLQFGDQAVLLHFWATWCAPCLEEFPKLMALQNQLQDRPIVIVAVSLDSDLQQAKKFLNQLPKPTKNFLILHDPEQRISAQYGTHKLPESYLINRQGVVVDKIIGSRDWSDGITINYLKLLSLVQKP